ncbi:hypothetical protein TNCT_532791 [Trichonephila clavata]|uniref:Uncharacterized protein n=1 Tax=Trichonephila clavata TaxID=2740835 RepID=A0A8X6GD50_TRICU|nr:hypothetical protein TNCT_532791 [Trichonephila clavata]
MGKPRKQCSLVGNENFLNIVGYVQTHIVLINLAAVSPKDQEETDNSSPSKSCKEENYNISQNMNTSHKHSRLSVPRSLLFKNLDSNEKDFQLSNNKTSSFQKEHVAPYTMTVSSKQNSVMSDNQISQVTKTLSSSTPKKNQFRHQQSEGFKIHLQQHHKTSNLNPEDS